jgi:hypothetical protein
MLLKILDLCTMNSATASSLISNQILDTPISNIEILNKSIQSKQATK